MIHFNNCCLINNCRLIRFGSLHMHTINKNLYIQRICMSNSQVTTEQSQINAHRISVWDLKAAYELWLRKTSRADGKCGEQCMDGIHSVRFTRPVSVSIRTVLPPKGTKINNILLNQRFSVLGTVCVNLNQILCVDHF